MVGKCPNKSSEDWKELVSRVGEVGAMSIYKRNGEQIPDMSNFSEDADLFAHFSSKETLTKEAAEDFQRKKAALADSLDADVILDTSIEGAGQLETGTDTPTIRVNPNYMGGDTLIHEYGHLYIDVLGGMENSMIRQGRKYLEGTDLERRITDQYRELSREKLDKEILATAIGQEGQNIFDNQTTFEKFKSWLRLFFNRIKKSLGLDYNVALDLANQLLSNQVAEQLRTELSADVQFQKTQNSPVLNQRDIVKQRKEVLSNIKNALTTKMNRYEQIMNEDNPNEDKQEALKNLRDLVEDFKKADDVQSMMQYIGKGLEETQQMKDRLRGFQTGEYKVTAKRLRDIHNYVQAYSYAEQIRNLLLNDADLHGKFMEETITEGDKQTAIEALDELIKNHSDINNVLTTQAQHFMARKLAQRGGLVHANYREQYKEEFRKQNDISRGITTTYRINGEEVSKKEFQQAATEYANEKIAENKRRIFEEERDHYRNLLVGNDVTDIGKVESYWMDPGNISDEMVQVAHEMLEEADYKTMRDFVSKFKDADDIFIEFNKENPESDQKEKYDVMIEDEVDENGNKTGEKSQYLTGRYYSGFLEKFWEVSAKKREAVQSGDDNAIEQADKDMRKFFENETKEIGGRNIPKDKWKNPQWDKLQEEREKGTPTGQMFDFILQTRGETDSIYPNKQVITYDFSGHKFRKIPAINANNMERVTGDGFYHAIKQSWKDIAKVRAQDIEYRPEQVEEQESNERKLAEEEKRIVKQMGDEAGGLHMSKPVYYRRNIPKGDQSYDLLSAHLLDNAMAVNFKHKSMIQPDLELLHMLSSEREVTKTESSFMKGTRKVVNLFSGKHGEQEDLKVDGDTTKAHQALTSMLEGRLYGVKKLGDKMLNKWADNLMNYTGDVFMIGNHLTAIANTLHGNLMTWVESIGGQEFTKENVKNAQNKYWADLMSIKQDIGKRRKYSKTNLLMERYDPAGEMRPVAQRFVQDTRFKQMADKSTLHGLMRMAEHNIHGTFMYTVLDNMKVKDKDGNFLARDEDGKVITTDSIEEAMSLDEAHRIEDGRLVINERVASTTNTMRFGREEYGIGEASDIHRLMRDIAADLQGQYDNTQQSRAERRWYGRAFMMLRGWLPRGVTRRWRGFNTVKIDRNDLEARDRFYNRNRKNFKSGMYTDAFRLLFSNNILENFREGGVQGMWDVLKEDWNSMSEREYANVRKAVTEFALMGTTIASAYILKSLAEGVDDDDDEMWKQHLWYTTFLAKRLNSELSFYINPQETLRLMQSPAASVSILADTTHLLTQMTSDFPFVTGMEKYERGKRAGQFKLRKDVEDVAPVFNQLNRNVQEAANWLFKEQVL